MRIEPNYDQVFDWYVVNRSRQNGLRELESLVVQIPAGSPVLDLGCGHGQPIAGYLLGKGFSVYGIDSSPKMVEQFKKNFPQATVVCGRMQDSDFFGRTYSAVIAWGVIFHLSEADQKRVFVRVATVLRPGGLFIFSAQKDTFHDTCLMDDILFPYISLGNLQYHRLLGQMGMKLVDEHYDLSQNYVYLFKKPG